MLLDEPTNHLDMPSVAWLGDFLQRYRRSFVLICHDREFLDEQIQRVISFEPEGVRQYRGTYVDYRRQREEEEIVLENKARNLQREREKAEQFIERFRAQANKAKAVQSRHQAAREARGRGRVRKTPGHALWLPALRARWGPRSSRFRGLAKAYGEHKVFEGLDLSVARGEKIGIIGVNGAGKTTLLRMIAGEIPHDDGELSLGHKVTPGYYAQHHAESLQRELSVFDEVAQREPHAGQTRVRNGSSGRSCSRGTTSTSGSRCSRVASEPVWRWPSC